MLSPDYSSVFARNYDASRYDQMPWQVRQQLVAARDAKHFDVPILVWRDEYATNPQAFINLCRYISDYMYLGPHPLYGPHNPNRPEMYGIVDGKINSRDYEPMMRLFGDVSAIGVKDNHFFHTGEETLSSQVLSQPFDFSARNINTAFALEKILDDSKKGAQIGIQQLLASMQAAGDAGLQQLQNPKVKLPKTPDDWLNYATGQEQIEGIMYKLLQHNNNRCDFQTIAKQALEHKFRVNAQFAMIDPQNGDVNIKSLHPDAVRWMAGKPVETLEDPSVFAVQVSDYMTPTELVNTYGVGRLNTGTGVKGAFRYVDGMLDKYKNVGYDPMGTYWSERGISADTGNYCMDDSAREYTTQQVNWMQTRFYPRWGVRSKLMAQILVQKNYFLMQFEKRFFVEKVEKGVRSPATDKELKNWQSNRANVEYDIDFTPVGDTQIPKRSNVKTYSRPRIMSFTRAGHDGFFDIGHYQYGPDFDSDKQERDKIGWPIKGQISYKKSMATLGHEDAIRVNALMQKIDLFMGGIGHETALVISKTQGKDPVSYLYNGKMTGVIEVDPTKYQSGNQAEFQHLKTIQLGSEIESMVKLQAAADAIVTGYLRRIGAGPDVQGNGNPYQSGKQQQLNLAGQQLLNITFNWEHWKFMSQLLQGAADVDKVFFAKDEQVALLLGKGEIQVLKLTTELRTADFAIYLKPGADLAKKKQALDQLVQMLMQSGGAEEAEGLMAIILSDNPDVGFAQYRQILGQIMERQASSQQSAAQAAQIQADEAEKTRAHEILKLQMTINGNLAVKRMEITKQTDKNEFDGIMNDINNTVSREDMILQQQMTNEQAEREAQMQTQEAAA